MDNHGVGAGRAAKAAVLAVCLSWAGLNAAAQMDDRGAAPAPVSLDTLLTSIVQDTQALEVAKACNWSEPLYRLATQSMLDIRVADLRSKVPADKQGIVDTTLANGRAAVAGFACQTPDGKSPDQRGKVELFVMDQYWRMIAHIDVLGSYRWNQPFRFTPDERTALDAEIKHIQAFKGYSYYSVANPLETMADKTAALACRERPPADKTCKPVPADQEGLASAVRTILTTTEAFGKAVAADKIAERKALLAAIGGDATKFYTIGDTACERNALVLNMGDSLKRTETVQDTFGPMTSEVVFAEKFQFGNPERTGWALLFRSIMTLNNDPPYMVLAENGGEWDEDSARAGAGQVTRLSDEIQANIDARNLPAAQKAEAIAVAKETMSETYFNNFKSMGLMQSLMGNGGVTLAQCPAL